jgi:hypothetical protein
MTTSDTALKKIGMQRSAFVSGTKYEVVKFKLTFVMQGTKIRRKPYFEKSHIFIPKSAQIKISFQPYLLEFEQYVLGHMKVTYIYHDLIPCL